MDGQDLPPAASPSGPKPQTPSKENSIANEAATDQAPATVHMRPSAMGSTVPGQKATSTFSEGQVLGNYEFIRPLGQGGMGIVYLARDLKLGRLVAIKHLRSLDAKASEFFLNEARLTARCNHENIVTIHEVDQHEGMPYMVLEYLEGQTLKAWLKEYGLRQDHPVPANVGQDDSYLERGWPGTPIVLKGHTDRIMAAAFNPDGTRIASCGWGNEVRIWNADGRGTPTILRGHESHVICGAPGGYGAFHPDGGQLATISDDKTIRLWDMSGTRKPIIIRVPEVGAYSVAFSPDGTRLVTASHVVRVPATASQLERVEHVAKVWNTPRSIRDLDDPMLWATTTYCPSVEKRMKLLSLPQDLAERQYERFLAKFAATR